MCQEKTQKVFKRTQNSSKTQNNMYIYIYIHTCKNSTIIYIYIYTYTVYNNIYRHTYIAPNQINWPNGPSHLESMPGYPTAPRYAWLPSHCVRSIAPQPQQGQEPDMFWSLWRVNPSDRMQARHGRSTIEAIVRAHKNGRNYTIPQSGIDLYPRSWV